MSKFSKITIFLLIILLSVCTFSFATDINMNIIEENNTSNSNVFTYSNNSNNYNNTVNSNNTSTSYNTITDASSYNSSSNVGTETQVSSISKNDIDDGLGLSNILNILLIVVGVVLILLSIAILIRLNG